MASTEDWQCTQRSIRKSPCIQKSHRNRTLAKQTLYHYFLFLLYKMYFLTFLNSGWNKSNGKWIPLLKIYKEPMLIFSDLLLYLTHLRVSSPGNPPCENLTTYLLIVCLPWHHSLAAGTLWCLLVLPPSRTVPHTGSCSIIMVDGWISEITYKLRHERQGDSQAKILRKSILGVQNSK